MSPELLQIFTEAGPLAAFAAYLAWMQTKATARHDKAVADFQAQIDRLVDKSDAEEERLRDRYDRVISKYDDERRQLLEGMSNDIRLGLSEMRSQYERFNAERLQRAARGIRRSDND